MNCIDAKGIVTTDPSSTWVSGNRTWVRIYHYHIRRTGGTSFNQAFLSLGGENGADVYRRLACAAPHRLVSGDKRFVGWDRRLIEQGDYFYGFSHIPKYRLDLPAGTFTFTCLRDPIHRVLSHYRLLRRFERDEIPHPCMEREGKWLGSCLDDFLDNLPREDLLNQLYMFSESFDVDVAFDNIVNCSHFSFTEERARGLEGLSSRLGIHLDLLHANDAPIPFSATAGQLHRLRCELDAEYRLVEMLRRHATGPNDESTFQPQTFASPGTSLLGVSKAIDMPGKSHFLREIGS